VDLLRSYSNDLSVKIRLQKVAEALSAAKTEVRETPKVRRHKLTQRLGPDVCDQITVGYLRGTKTPALAEQYGVSKTAIKRLLHERGIALPYRGLTGDQIKRACGLYAGGMSLAKVAAELGCSRKAVTTALENAGVTRRDCHGRDRS
jgi:AraC-like DNA-binding protein